MRPAHSCRAAINSGLPWRPRCYTNPRFCFLDEPTSGADPLARRAFWRRITALAEQGVTIIVTTHFMQEAEYCDRIAIMDSGKNIGPRLARRGSRAGPHPRGPIPAWMMPLSRWSSGRAVERIHQRPPVYVPLIPQPQRDGTNGRPRGVRFLFQCMADEAATHSRIGDEGNASNCARPLEHRDRCGAAADPDPFVRLRSIARRQECSDCHRDGIPDSGGRGFPAGFQLSPYFHPFIMRSMPPAQRQLLEHRADGILRIPADFSRHLAAGDAEVQLIVHGGDANRARIIEGYVQGVVGVWAARLASQGSVNPSQPVNVRARLWFNEANDSSYFLVPGLVVLVMTLIGGLLPPWSWLGNGSAVLSRRCL